MAFRNRKKNYPYYQTTHFSDIREMVENAGKRFTDKVCFSYRKKPNDKEPAHYTYGEGRDFVRDLGTELIDRGLCGKNVALIGEAAPEWVFSYFAMMASGVVSVPIDKELPAADMASILNSAECECVICSSSVSKKEEELKTLCPELKTFIVWGDKLAEGEVPLSEVRAAGAAKYLAGDHRYYENPLDPDALATIVFTSGTTGKGKGVMLSSRNICSDMEQGMYNFQVTDKTMCVLPPHHTFCSTVNLVGHYAQGCEIYISSGLRYIMKELEEFRPSHLILVPLFVETFYKRIMAEAEKTGQLKKLMTAIRISDALRKVGIDLRSVLFRSVASKFGGEVSMIICGGAALNPKMIDFFESIGITILNGYGITECAPLICCNRNEYRKDGSVGLPIVGGEMKIINPDENGEGEIAYRGSNVMLGYYHDEAATKAAIDEDGFFHTGDYGKVLFDGDDQWLYITGRLKNLIIFSNGKNVYPEEIETDIQGVYGVSEVVVYAGESKSDPSKEVIVAEIYPDAEALERHEITDVQKYFDDAVRKINEKNVSYKHVGLVKIRDTEFPKNTSKKIVRFKIDKTIA